MVSTLSMTIELFTIELNIIEDLLTAVCNPADRGRSSGKFAKPSEMLLVFH